VRTRADNGRSIWHWCRMILWLAAAHEEGSAMKRVLLVLSMVAAASLAQAQLDGGVLISPGLSTVFVSPAFNGSANVLRPNQSSLFFNPPSSGSTITRGSDQPSYYIPLSPPPISGFRTTPYGIVMPGHPSVLDRPLAPFGITLPPP